MAEPNFKFRSQFPISGIAQLLAQKPVREEQIRASQQSRQSQRLNSVLQSLQLGAQFERQARQRRTQLEAEEAARETKEKTSSLAQSLATDPSIVPGVVPIGPQTADVQQRQDLVRTAAELSPATGVKQVFKEGPSELDIANLERIRALTKKARQDAKGKKGGGGALDTPSKLKAQILSDIFAGNTVSKEKRALVASDLRDPDIGTAVRVYFADLGNLTKSSSQRAVEIGKILRSIKKISGTSLEADPLANLPD